MLSDTVDLKIGQGISGTLTLCGMHSKCTDVRLLESPFYTHLQVKLYRFYTVYTLNPLGGHDALVLGALSIARV
jgi:hypothetical protein